MFQIIDAECTSYVPIEIFNCPNAVNVLIEYPLSFMHLHEKIISSLYFYFRLDIDEVNLLKAWKSVKQCENVFKNPKIAGIRLLQQDPYGALISFICSQNNSILRIKKMVTVICQLFGKKVDYKGANSEHIVVHSFPSPKDMCVPELVNILISNKFGYRSKYIANAVQFCIDYDLFSRGDFFDFFGPSFSTNLQKIKGVGIKVADCVSLMAFNCTWIVPVDTHMNRWYYRMRLLNSSSIKKQHSVSVIQNYFKSLFGEYAGWAHLVTIYNHF